MDGDEAEVVAPVVAEQWRADHAPLCPTLASRVRVNESYPFVNFVAIDVCKRCCKSFCLFFFGFFLGLSRPCKKKKTQV